MRTGWVDVFECDLTDEQKRLCEWIAEQAQAGVRRVSYEEAQAELGIGSDKELTCMLRNMRERMDQIHEMVQSPIVNTAYPYFEIHVDADHIWDRYLDAEEASVYSEPVSFHQPQALVRC